MPSLGLPLCCRQSYAYIWAPFTHLLDGSHPVVVSSHLHLAKSTRGVGVESKRLVAGPSVDAADNGNETSDGARVNDGHG